MEEDEKPNRQEEKQQLKKAQTLLRLLLTVLILAAIIGISIWIVPMVMELGQEEGRAGIESKLRSYGVGGWFAFLGIQILQVVIAMIPGEPVEIFGGVLYGAVGGTLSCMLGVLIGSLIVSCLVKKLGMPLVTTFIAEEKIHKLWFLRDERRFERISMILFFLPGTPKDLLTWAVGLTSIPPLRFFLKASLARIPSILTSTLVGASLMQGDFLGSALIFLVTALISLLGVGIHNAIANRQHSRRI